MILFSYFAIEKNLRKIICCGRMVEVVLPIAVVGAALALALVTSQQSLKAWKLPALYVSRLILCTYTSNIQSMISFFRKCEFE